MGVRDKIDEYMAQVNQYDAGRPTTKTADKPGLKVVDRSDVPKERFDASADAKSMGAQQPATREPAFGTFSTGRTPSFSWSNLRAPGRAGSGEGGLLSGPDPTISRKPITGGPDVSGLQAAEAKSGLRPKIPVGSASSFAGTQETSGQAQPSRLTKNAFAGNYAATDASGQGIYTDPETKRTAIRLTGDAGDKFMQDQNKLIAEGKGKAATAEDMAARRKAMGEYSGMFRQSAPEAPLTARPGNTLQASPVEYRRNVVGSKTVGGLPAEESFTPTRAAQSAQRAAIPMTGNPIADQRNAEAALAARQAEVMQAERNTPGLLYGPGSRDYIDPRLSETEQRARQMEIAEQRIEDMRQARDATIAQTQARDAALAYNGLPTDEARNRAMEPYAERRTTINQRNANMAMAQEQEASRMAAADKVDERAATERQDVRKDATDRYVADKNAELAQSNAELGAQSKRLDREATMKAALLKAENTKDPVLLKKLDGFNSWLESVTALGQAPTDEQWKAAQKLYGVEEVFAPADPYAKVVIPAPK